MRRESQTALGKAPTLEERKEGESMNEPDTVGDRGTEKVQHHEVSVTMSATPHDQGPHMH